MFLRSGKQKKNSDETYVPRQTHSVATAGGGYDRNNKRRKTLSSAEKHARDLKLLQEAREAAPALFAKPGDKFEWTGRYGDDYVIEYVGRNMTPSKVVEFRGETTGEYMSPKKGWLIFRNTGGLTPLNVTSGGIRDACRAWPLACYSHYNEEGEMDEDTMCISPDQIGALKKYGWWHDSDSEEVGGDEGEGGAKRESVEEEIIVSKKLLQEAKRAVPVLFAKPGDQFVWYHPLYGSLNWHGGDPCIMTYVGKNTLPPKTESPEIGWLVFKNRLPGKYDNHIDITNGGIRDAIGAWPMSRYSHYSCRTLNEATALFELALWKWKIEQADDTVDRNACRIEVPGPVKDTIFGYLAYRRKAGTLCIPPSKCGPIKVYKKPKYDDYW